MASLNLYPDSTNIPEYYLEPETMEVTTEINCFGLRNLTPAVGFLPVNKAFIKFDLNSLQKSDERTLANVQTQPSESGSDPTINAVVRFNFNMPMDKLFAPTLTCIVYDCLFKGLSQPQIGNFAINIGEYYHKRVNIKTTASDIEVKNDDVQVNIDYFNERKSTMIKKVARPSIEGARKGEFVIKPTFSMFEGKLRQEFKPDSSFMKLGYNRNPGDDLMHYRYVLGEELENSEYIDKSPFETIPIKKGKDRGDDG